MRCALLAATDVGLALAKTLQPLLDGADVYAKKNPRGESADCGDVYFYEKLAALTAEIFAKYDALIFIMAAGITVRMIAPHLKSKLTDPAVLVMDERAGHVVSLLSGHIGGANALAEKIASYTGADPVITTATDVGAKRAADSVARELALRPFPKENIKIFNGALLRGEKIFWYVDETLTEKNFYLRELQKRNIAAKCTAENFFAAEKFSVYITAKKTDATKKLLVLSPRLLVAGVGCRKGTGADEITAALYAACEKIGRDVAAIGLIASAKLKENEPGLLEAAKKLGAKTAFFSADELAEKTAAWHLKESTFVKKIVGTGNVAEAAALCAANGRFALTKQKYAKVTVALLWEK